MVKQSEDYISQVQEKFPYWSKKELSKIINYGLKVIIWACKQGCDFSFGQRGQSKVFIGNISKDKNVGVKNFGQKISKKERIISKLRKTKFDGYYYIGLTDEQNSKLKSKNQNTKYIFKNINAYKLINELYHKKYIKHIWRIPYPLDCGWSIHLDKYQTNDAEYMGPNLFEKYHKEYKHGNSE